jgi:hypothetical protein
MKSSTRARLILAGIMVLALLSYLTIAANASKAVGGGMYEVAASRLDYADLAAFDPDAAQAEMARLAAQHAPLVSRARKAR